MLLLQLRRSLLGGLVSLALASMAAATNWYVAPAGNDTAVGSLDHPFATLSRAQEAVHPGDTVFFRGGTYRLTEAGIMERRGIYAYIEWLEKSGEKGRPITYAAYEDEKPVFDCSEVKPAGLRIDAFFIGGSWLHLRGLEVTGVQVTLTGHTQSICFENSGSHNVFERLSMHDGQGIGFYTTRGADLLILNCDAWNNWDYTSEDGKGGNVDGFGGHPAKGATGIVFRGCRAWCNSDDGYDCINSAEAVTFENCWAFRNGLNAKGEKLGDGNGFKAGGYGTSPVSRLPAPIPRHVVRFCVAVANRASGFYANHHLTGSDWLNNSAMANTSNFNFLGRLPDNVTDVPGSGHRIRNNLSFRSRSLVSNFQPEGNEAEHNTFASDLRPSDKDFVSVDAEELQRPRQANGELPEIQFLHPVPGSPLAAYGAFVRPAP